MTQTALSALAMKGRIANGIEASLLQSHSSEIPRPNKKSHEHDTIFQNSRQKTYVSWLDKHKYTRAAPSYSIISQAKIDSNIMKTQQPSTSTWTPSRITAASQAVQYQTMIQSNLQNLVTFRAIAMARSRDRRIDIQIIQSCRCQKMGIMTPAYQNSMTRKNISSTSKQN
jgi:hypothetical protein